MNCYRRIRFLFLFGGLMFLKLVALVDFELGLGLLYALGVGLGFCCGLWWAAGFWG
jgi:hypothetical protein